MVRSAQKDILNLTPADDPAFLERHVEYWKMDTNPLLEPEPLKVMQENTLLDVFMASKDERLIPKVPIYMYAGISDNVCPIEPIDKLVAIGRNTVRLVRMSQFLSRILIFSSSHRCQCRVRQSQYMAARRIAIRKS